MTFPENISENFELCRLSLKTRFTLDMKRLISPALPWHLGTCNWTGVHSALRTPCHPRPASLWSIPGGSAPAVLSKWAPDLFLQQSHITYPVFHWQVHPLECLCLMQNQLHCLTPRISLDPVLREVNEALAEMLDALKRQVLLFQVVNVTLA